MYAKNEVLLQPGWIRYYFEFREPEFYKLVTTAKRDYYSKNIYTVPVGQCNKETSVEESKYEEKLKTALIVPGEYISKNEPRKILVEKTMCLYIVPGVPT